MDEKIVNEKAEKEREGENCSPWMISPAYAANHQKSADQMWLERHLHMSFEIDSIEVRGCLTTLFQATNTELMNWACFVVLNKTK